MRVQVVGGSNVFYYLHSDHLGSTTALSTSAVGGGLISGSTARYLPFGAWRTTPTQTLTDRGFTGHLENMELGLIYMNARYYVPAIGRFASADTIVPEPAEPQSFNRYSYVNNNPLIFTDPTGHRVCEGTDNCKPPAPNPAPAAATPIVNFTGEGWDESETATIESATLEVGQAYARVINQRNRYSWRLGESSSYRPVTARQAFRAVHGGAVTFHGVLDNPGFLGERTGTGITVHQLRGTPDRMWALHELGHDFNGNAIRAGNNYGQPYVDLRVQGIYANGRMIAGNTNPKAPLDDSTFQRTYAGFQDVSYPWIQNDDRAAGEDYADMFSNWVANSFTTDAAGTARYNWMESHMSGWISLAVSYNQ